MTPEAAIYAFLSGFGMPAYMRADVPEQDSPEWEGFPYLTYDVTIPDMFEQTVMEVDLWFQTSTERIPNAKVREIGQAIPPSSKVPIACDNGGLLIGRGSPWAQSITVDGEAPMVKRRLLNMTIESVLYE